MASDLLAKAAELLAKSASKVDLKALAQELRQVADIAMKLVHEALNFVEWSRSAVRKGVAEEAQESADKLYEMARKCMVQMEEALEVVLGELRESATGLLKKAADLLEAGGHHLKRLALAPKLEQMASTADDLARNALAFVKWSDSAVGKEVAQEAEQISYDLTIMSIKLKHEYYPSIEQMEEAMLGKPFTQNKMEEATHDADVLAPVEKFNNQVNQFNSNEYAADRS
ncbi:hypothetical protein Tco_1177197, partial [Tanacetum coccineum]